MDSSSSSSSSEETLRLLNERIHASASWGDNACFPELYAVGTVTACFCRDHTKLTFPFPATYETPEDTLLASYFVRISEQPAYISEMIADMTGLLFPLIISDEGEGEGGQENEYNNVVSLYGRRPASLSDGSVHAIVLFPFVYPHVSALGETTIEYERVRSKNSEYVAIALTLQYLSCREQCVLNVDDDVKKTELLEQLITSLRSFMIDHYHFDRKTVENFFCPLVVSYSLSLPPPSHDDDDDFSSSPMIEEGEIAE
jgi:hypothetical protein